MSGPAASRRCLEASAGAGDAAEPGTAEGSRAWVAHPARWGSTAQVRGRGRCPARLPRARRPQGWGCHSLTTPAGPHLALARGWGRAERRGGPPAGLIRPRTPTGAAIPPHPRGKGCRQCSSSPQHRGRAVTSLGRSLTPSHPAPNSGLALSLGWKEAGGGWSCEPGVARVGPRLRRAWA